MFNDRMFNYCNYGKPFDYVTAINMMLKTIKFLKKDNLPEIEPLYKEINFSTDEK